VLIERRIPDGTTEVRQRQAGDDDVATEQPGEDLMEDVFPFGNAAHKRAGVCKQHASVFLVQTLDVGARRDVSAHITQRSPAS